MHRSVYFGYGIAVTAVAVTALIRALLSPFLAGDMPLVLFLLPVMIAALFGGIGPGLLATLLAGFIGFTYFVPPSGSVLALQPDDLIVAGLFLVEGGLASWLIGSRTRAFRAAAERMQVEDALRRSEERYRAIVESQAEMVCRFRPDGEIIFVNGGYARARGTTPEALLGRNFWDFVPDEDRADVQATLQELTPERPEARIENRFETAEGVRWTLWTNRGLAFDEHGRLTEAQSTGVDITDRKEAERALHEANRRKNEFLAVLGHELRNPLAPLRSGLDFLRSGPRPELIANVRAMMERQLDHLVRLVEDLLDLSRINRGEIALQRTSLDLRGVADAAVELALPLINERRHALSVTHAPLPLPVDGDFQRLTQVVSNLLNNAAKYTAPGGEIALSTAVEGNVTVIRVKDSGFGFPPERLDTLFEMFGRIPEHRERTGGGGLGIGLALSRQLVAQHDGSIEARSEGLGRGSEFVVRLPLAEAKIMPEASRPPPSLQITPRRILIVDDNVDAAESLRLVLELDGHSVHTVHDSRDALATLSAQRPEVALLDIGLPDIDGYELARRIRSLPGGDDILLVAITGWGQEEDKRRAREAGFDDHLTKPVDSSLVAALIESELAAAEHG